MSKESKTIEAQSIGCNAESERESMLDENGQNKALQLQQNITTNIHFFNNHIQFKSLIDTLSPENKKLNILS